MKKIIPVLTCVYLLIGLLVLDSCKKDPVLATLTTSDISDITINSFLAGGSITKDGDAEITDRGVCYSLSATPVINGLHISVNKGTGSFSTTITGLTPNTIYHIRAYATNKVGTAYGNEVTASTIALVAPTLSTVAVTSISLTTGISGGNITSDGNDPVTSRGVCWATTANPATTDSKTSDGTGSGSFVSTLTGLTAATTYHVRAYAINSIGTSYGNDISFTTLPVIVPALTTTAVTDITTTTAISGGNITSDGGGAITSRGVCWATTTNPTIANSKTSNGTGTGIFISNITGLTASTTYHVRSYATNSAGTAYGNDITFAASSIALPSLTTTAITSITLTTAVSGGNITSDGGGSITARGVCWSTTTAPTIANSKTTDGTGTGSFTSNLTVLLPGTTYYVRAYATNSSGTAYGNEISFVTLPVTLPVLTTTAASSITQTTAASGGNISSNGGGTVTARGVCWSNSANPTIANEKTTDGTGNGIFTSSLTGLTAGTTYHIRAYATNSAGTAYGNDVSFTTQPVQLATITTTAVTSITLNTAVSGGNITSDGGGAISVSGVCWSTAANPTTGNSLTTNGTFTGSFSSSLTGLTTGTTYYVRAYATNSAGTAYGNQLIFSTKIADIDGNTYNTVQIGTQLWMSENLKTTHFSNGPTIPNVVLDADWIVLTTPALCWYNNDAPTYKPIYGAIYNWFAVTEGNLCPAGWHAPSDQEFNTMELFLGVPSVDINFWGWRGTNQGDEIKSTTGWTGGLNGSNTSGFNGLPGGYRYGLSGTYNDLGNLTYWWSTTSVDDGTNTIAWYRRVDGVESRIYKAGVLYQGGKYVRCLKD